MLNFSKCFGSGLIYQSAISLASPFLLAMWFVKKHAKLIFCRTKTIKVMALERPVFSYELNALSLAHRYLLLLPVCILYLRRVHLSGPA